MKKILAILMASILALGVLTVAVSAEEELITPAYEAQTYDIADIVALVDEGEDVYLNPTDIIMIADAEEDPSVEPAEEGEEPEGPEATISDVLIVEYLADDTAISGNNVEKFADYQGNEYAVKGIGDYTDYAYQGGQRKTDFAIDFESVNGYAFKSWKVKSVYSGKEFNRVILVAEWDVPALSGWSGFLSMFHGYAKMVIDYIINYLSDLFTRLGEFFV